ncbi:hypothetical protein Nepgr_031002 [Nepenthes gracilis]|uniref:GATA-type domain-containing protein n=1 Tax=Nepenthes gracilis TaxID=150966 RepID=A0AAD3Y6M1_NEPGR|nr:hypothetical protein Nepgr_031002 [Nepenthes gracilis]
MGSSEDSIQTVDLSKKKSEFGDMDHKYSEGASSEESQVSEIKKTCADCGTSKTPLWRGGPAGPKSLCNACGIRSRKKRRTILGLNKLQAEEKKSSNKSRHQRNSSGNFSNSKLGSPLNQRLLALGREVLMRRSTVDKQTRKLGEEEQAAVLLMALSYASVYA